MLFPKPLIEGVLQKRYKRFLGDLLLNNETVVGVHCTNTGSMKGILATPQRAWVLKSDNLKRKLPYTLEILEIPQGNIGVNTHRTNYLALEALQNKLIPELADINIFQTEKKYGTNSRIDILGITEDNQEVYIEVKNVSLAEGRKALFPDSVTERGTKHLEELIKIIHAGKRAVMLFIAQREDVENFSPESEIDPLYAATLKKAFDAGVEVYAYNCKVTPLEIVVSKRLQVIL
ncbi:MAG: DNA/RNA nuclease SfsA [Candidatus Gracilibacteria bacterium]